MADIPGYYYDQLTCRYFRSPPAHVAYMTGHSHSPSTHSKESPKPPPLPPTPHSKHHPSHRHHPSLRTRERQSLLSQLSSQQLRHDPLLPPSSNLFQTLLACCKRRENATFDLPLSFYEGFFPVAGMRDILVCHRGNPLISVVRFENPNSCEEKDAIFVFDAVRSKSAKQLRVQEGVSPIRVQFSPGRVIAVATCAGRQLLLTSYHRGVQVVWLDGGGPPVSVPIGLSDTLTSCALEQVGGELLGCVGLSDGCVRVLQMVEGGRAMEIVAYLTLHRSQAMSLIYAPESSLLFAGTRDGYVRFWDCRAGPRIMGSYFLPSGGARPSVVQLHPLTDGRSVVANCMTSKLLLLDLRMPLRVVLRYPSYYSSYLHCRSTIDHSENCLAALSRDRVIRIWSLRGGALLRSIEESEYMGTEELYAGELPTISYAANFLGAGGAPALLVGSHKGITAMS